MGDTPEIILDMETAIATRFLSDNAHYGLCG